MGNVIFAFATATVVALYVVAPALAHLSATFANLPL